MSVRDAYVPRPAFVPGFRGGEIETLAGTRTLLSGEAEVQSLDPGGAGRNVILPDDARAGDWFLIVNRADAAETLTVKLPDGATTLGSCGQNGRLLVVFDGTEWR